MDVSEGKSGKLNSLYLALLVIGVFCISVFLGLMITNHGWITLVRNNTNEDVEEKTLTESTKPKRNVGLEIESQIESVDLAGAVNQQTLKSWWSEG